MGENTLLRKSRHITLGLFNDNVKTSGKGITKT